MNKKILIAFIISTLIFSAQFLFDSNFLVNNDLNGNIVPLIHFKQSLLVYHQFPQWNTYINQGIPSIADPLYGIYNPLISIPILLLPYILGIKIMYLIAIFISSVSMFMLLKIYKVSDLFSSIIAITYASGTYLSSRINAGHLEKIISFPLLPLFLFCLIKIIREKNILWSGITAIILSLILFSGDIYNMQYCLYSIAGLFLFFLYKDRKISMYLMFSIIMFFLFSSIKILPMTQLPDYISKIKEPFAGGLNMITITYNLFLPFDSIFNKFFSANEFIAGFGWWESLSFIGPFSIIGLFYILRLAFTKYDTEKLILVLLSVLFLLLSAPDSLLNPYHYLITNIKTLQFFHVPSRILALWGMVILLSFGIYLDKWRNRKLALFILFINLLIVFIFSQSVLSTKRFYEIDQSYNTPLDWIKNNNQYDYLTVHEIEQGKIPQDKLYLNNLHMLLSNYGFILKNSLAEKYNFKGNNIYNDIKPGFLITTRQIQDSNLKKLKNFDNNIFIYKDLRALPFASIDGKPQKAYFYPNKITISANSQKKDQLKLLESRYPGWSVFIDGNRSKILDKRFLEVETLQGTHKYEFIYSSKLFIYGLLVSAISITCWLIYILGKYRKKII